VDVIPVAPSTAWLMLCAGLGLFLHARWPDRRVVRGYVHTTAALVTTVVVCVLLAFWWGFDVVFEEWLAATRPRIDGYPTGSMAVLTALLFQIYAVALWSETSLSPRWPRCRWLAAAGAGLMMFTTVVVLFTHLAGAGVLYPGGRVPIALATAGLFTFLGMGLLAGSDPGQWLMQLLATRPGEDSGGRRFEWTLVASVTAMSVLLIAVGAVYLRRQVTEVRQAAQHELSTLAELKAEQVARWQRERQGDARFFFQARFTAQDVQAFLRRPDSLAARTNLTHWLNLLKAGERYRWVALFDSDLQLRLALPAQREVPDDATRQFVHRVMQAGDVVMDELRQGDAGDRHLDLGFPVFAPNAADPPLGVILLRLDPHQFLYPLLWSWPAPSETAEALLVRRDGENWLMLGSPQPAWLATRVRAGDLGVFEAVDYRNRPVLAALRPVPGSSWHLVVKQDLEEVYVAARRQAWTTSSLLALLALALGMGAGLLWQQHKRAQLSTIMRELSERKRIEQALCQSEERLRTIVEHSSQLFYAHTPEGLLTYVSPQSLQLLGCPPEEALTRWTEFLTNHPANEVGRELTEAAIRTGERQPSYELELRTRNGRKVWAEINESPVVVEGRTAAIVGSLTDITQRKRSEQIIGRLARLGRDLAAVSDAHEAARAVADAAQDLLGWDAYFMKVRTPDLSRAQYALSMDTLDGQRVEVPPRLGDQITPIERRVMTEGPQLVLRASSAPESGFVPFGDAQRPSASLLYVPLRHRARYLGLLSIQSYQPGAYDHAALDLLQTLADHAAGALERIRAEHALRASEDRYRQLFEAESDAILLIENETGRILQANGAASTLYGYSRDELLAKCNTDLSAEPVETRRVTQETTLDLERVISIPLRWHRRRDGTAFPVELTGRFFCLEDVAVHIVAVRDITDRLRADAALRETERRLSTLVGNLPAGFAYRCRNDRNWTMEFITAGCENLIGCAPEELTSGRLVYKDLIRADDRERVWQEIQAALSAARAYQIEYRVVTRRHEEKWVWEQGCGVFDEQGRVRALEGLVTDITARKHAEAALRELSGRLLAAQDAERRRIARELHDTTAQTLAALCMNLTMLETQIPGAPERAGQLLADALALGARAAQEVRTMSYLLHPPILEHAGLAGAIKEYAAGFSRRSGIQVQVNIGDGVGRFPPEVELALLRLVQESLGNVHRHSGSPTAAIGLRLLDGTVVLDVADAGKGFRLPEGAAEGEEHIGVGIAGMRERLRHLGGRLEIESSQRGTTVRATLPLPDGGASANSGAAQTPTPTRS
jgi:PAS domain S-box-containing protein